MPPQPRLRGDFLSTIGVDLHDQRWVRLVKDPVSVGTPVDRLTRVPQGDAGRILRAVVRLVADLPAGGSTDVVWVHGASELLVRTDTVTLACTTGLVRIGVEVDCDQLPQPTAVVVPLAVGTEEEPSGLVAQAYDRVDAPPAVADVWSDALTAFAWECLVEVARRICADLGRDTRGRPLVPGSIGATGRALLLRPMARHDVRLRPLR